MCVVWHKHDVGFHGELRTLHVQLAALYFPICYFPVSILRVWEYSTGIDRRPQVLTTSVLKYRYLDNHEHIENDTYNIYR